MRLFVDTMFSETIMLSPAALGCYVRLMLVSWRLGPLPMDFGKLERFASGIKDHWDEIEPFVRLSEDRETFTIDSVESERAHAESKSEKAAASVAKRSINERASNDDRTINERSSMSEVRDQKSEIRSQKADSDTSGVPVDSNGAHPKEKRTKDSLTFDRETGWHGVTDADRSVWAEAYPGVDIDHELAAAKAWLLADWAKRRKSAWRRFLVGWLARSQDRAATTGQRTASVRQTSVERPANVPSVELPDEKRSSLTIWAAKKLRGLLDPADLAEAWACVIRWPEDIMYDRLQNVVSQSRDKGAPGKWLAAAIRHEPTGRLRPGECGAL